MSVKQTITSTAAGITIMRCPRMFAINARRSGGVRSASQRLPLTFSPVSAIATAIASSEMTVT